MFNHFFGGGFGGGVFEANYRAMPMAFIDKQSAEFGDKVILPPSALDRLASLHIEYPMLFKVENTTTGKFTHCGVLEFTAEEGCVYMPHWMMQNLLLPVGDMIKFRNVALPKGTYVKLQPATSDFLDITNPKAVLERTLRSYTCLTVGDCFVVNYNNRNYEIEVKEAKPGPAISVVETDCQVDFEAPKDYKEPERVFPNKPPAPKQEPMQEDKKAANGAGSSSSKADAAQEEDEAAATFLAFAGTARRLDGRTVTSSAAPVPVPLARPNSATALLSKTAEPAASSSSKAGGSGASGAGAGGGGGGKAGTFVSTGNRLLDKLERDRLAKAGGAPPSSSKPAEPAKPAQPADNKDQQTDNGSSFKAFAGKGYSLKG